VKVAGVWRYVYCAIDEYGQVIDVFLSARRDTEAAVAFFEHALAEPGVHPQVVTADRAACYPSALERVLPAAEHITGKVVQQRIEHLY
jgi:transposase-like protein